MIVNVDVQIAVEDCTVPASSDLALWVSRAIDAVGGQSNGDVSVRIVDLAEMQRLNAEFRDLDKPTNVLSFPAGDIDGLPPDAELPLGDLVVCAAVVSDEARQQGKKLHDHWAHMMVHGTLHLLGFDHEGENDAEAMEGLEIQILTAHGIANPYTI